MKTIRRRRPKIDVRRAVREWLVQDDAVKAFSERLVEAKGLLMKILESEGRNDERGSQWIRFPDDPVEGRITAIKRERRVTPKLDEERAEEYLKRRKLYSQCTETITVLDEAKILDLNFKGVISDADLETLYDPKETWAFVPQRVKQ
jgi:hypothetical protein